jgi:hypothetical protein
MLYRVFPWVSGAPANEPGGPLFVPRFDQGSGRHDNDACGVLYLSRSKVSPIAEQLRDYVGRPWGATRLLREGSPLSLASFDDEGLNGLLDLDDPRNLVTRQLRPSGVATRRRKTTQGMALGIYHEGVPGFEWWSAIEASWINVTLFEDRVTDRLTLAGEPEPLTLDHPVVREAAEAVGVLLSK